MAKRIDAEGAVLKNDDACYPRNEECTEGGDPTAPDEPEDCRKNEGDRYGDPMDVAMLPPDECILLQVGHVVERRGRFELENQPADVGVKEPFGDAIRVFIVVDMLVVTAVLAGPKEHGIFEGCGAKDHGKEPHDPVRLESEMRIEPMIPKRYRKSAREEHHKEEPDLEPINPEEPDISRYCREREQEGAHQKRAGEPIHPRERDS